MNNTKWWHLTQGERYEISIWLKEWKSLRRIGAKTWRSHTTISREVTRNSVFDKKTWWSKYLAIDAEFQRLQRRSKANQLHTILLRNRTMHALFFWELEKKWQSYWVDEIVWRLKGEWKSMVSTTTVYRYIHNHSPWHKKFLRYWRHWYKIRKENENQRRQLWNEFF